MNKLAVAGAISIALAMPWGATAQAPAPPSKQATPAAAAPAPKQAPVAAPASKPDAPVAAAAQPAAEPEKPAKRAHRRIPSHADARACLEFQTNLQVIKCAEKYRWAS
jgi:hypothetical protein